MTLPAVVSLQGSAQIQVSPHALARLHALSPEARGRLEEMLADIVSSCPSGVSGADGLLRLHVGAFVVLYNFAAEHHGLVVQHILVPAEQEYVHADRD